MNKFQQYKQKRIRQNPELWEGYNERFETFKLGILLKQAREKAGFTQKQMAERLNISAKLISKMENNAPDVKLSCLEKFASSLGKRIQVILD
ncbi:MAG: helix-turn-helix domain-containing protein [Desulfobacteraceae bacterium]|nr:helix-turn-helix domain-containing protein [Desulfobacteraceae bacterium]